MLPTHLRRKLLHMSSYDGNLLQRRLDGDWQDQHQGENMSVNFDSSVKSCCSLGTCCMRYRARINTAVHTQTPIYTQNCR